MKQMVRCVFYENSVKYKGKQKLLRLLGLVYTTSITAIKVILLNKHICLLKNNR